MSGRTSLPRGWPARAASFRTTLGPTFGDTLQSGDTPTRRSLTGALFVAVSLLIGCGADPPAAGVRVEVERRCSLTNESGMGFVIDNGLVLTSAHVVAGHSTATIAVDGVEGLSTVVAFDPDNDLAYLQPDARVGPGWPLANLDMIQSIQNDTSASVYVERDDRIVRLDVTIVRKVQIETEDIYIDNDVTRPGWELHYPIEPGDSGAALVVDGKVIGVIWARSRQAEDRAYAIDPVRGAELMNRQLAEGRVDVEPDIDLDRC